MISGLGELLTITQTAAEIQARDPSQHSERWGNQPQTETTPPEGLWGLRGVTRAPPPCQHCRGPAAVLQSPAMLFFHRSFATRPSCQLQADGRRQWPGGDTDTWPMAAQVPAVTLCHPGAAPAATRLQKVPGGCGATPSPGSWQGRGSRTRGGGRLGSRCSGGQKLGLVVF